MGYPTGQLGAMIRERRTAAGLTLEDVAERVGVTQGALSHIESGRRLPHPSNAVRIAQVLGVTEDEMMRLLDEEHAVRRRATMREGLAPKKPSARADDADTSCAPVANAIMPGFTARPIGALFASEDRDAGLTDDLDPFALRNVGSSARPYTEPGGVADLRDVARWSNDPSTRIEALDALADQAAQAIRTLRGMLGDEDPRVRSEARRLLLELDVRVTEE